MNKFSRWIRSKQGMTVLGAVVVLALVVAIFGSTQGWFGGPGTVLPPATLTNPGYEPPKNGFSCFPTCKEDDGRFLASIGAGLSSFDTAPTVLWISVAGDQASWTFSIFDGDSGKDVNSQLNYFSFNTTWIDYTNGNWDDAYYGDTTYTLYADPLEDGTGKTVVGTWQGNGSKEAMPNNGWWNTTIQNVEAARSPSRHFAYRLEAARPADALGINAFKLKAAPGYINAGYNGENGVQASFGLIAMLATTNDATIFYPQWGGYFNPGPLDTTKYDGNWDFQFYVPENAKSIALWDGDFDRGTLATDPLGDTDDLSSSGIPSFAVSSSVVRPEDTQGRGKPADNYTVPAYAVGSPIAYALLNPLGQPLYSNDNPSGTEEWEKFLISTDPNIPNADYYGTAAEFPTGYLPAGFYTMQIRGLDFHNTVWFRANYSITTPDDKCTPPVWGEGFCPRTVSYWKHEVQKNYFDKKPQGAKESKETMDWALRNIALASPIFRKGINICAPVAIADPTPLTPDEAQAIISRDYPSGIACDKQSMLAQTLQQSLANWFNLGSGKIGPATWVVLDVKNGLYEGSLWGALQEVQNIILNGGDMERAKQISDLVNNGINNGKVDTDVEENIDGKGEPVCSIYDTVIPPDQQKKCEDLPTPPPVVPPVVTPEPPTCTEGNNLGQGYAIIALNPADCQGQQNGLLFHGTSLTTIVNGGAWSNGCLRSVGTHSVTLTNGLVEYIGPNFGDMSLITPAPVQASTLMPESAWMVNPPNCDDPAAIHLDAKKDLKGDVNLAPGLYCVDGDFDIKAHQKVVGTGVTIYLMNGSLKINGQALVQLSAPFSNEDVSPALKGILFYVPGSNGGGAAVTLNGTSDSFFEGTIYAPGSEVEFLGTGNTVAHRSQIIGWDVRVGGTADLLIDWLGSILPICLP